MKSLAFFATAVTALGPFIPFNLGGIGKVEFQAALEPIDAVDKLAEMKTAATKLDELAAKAEKDASALRGTPSASQLLEITLKLASIDLIKIEADKLIKLIVKDPAAKAPVLKEEVTADAKKELIKIVKSLERIQKSNVKIAEYLKKQAKNKDEAMPDLSKAMDELKTLKKVLGISSVFTSPIFWVAIVAVLAAAAGAVYFFVIRK
jgi:hypothetical protein